MSTSKTKLTKNKIAGHYDICRENNYGPLIGYLKLPNTGFIFDTSKSPKTTITDVITSCKDTVGDSITLLNGTISFDRKNGINIDQINIKSISDITSNATKILLHDNNNTISTHPAWRIFRSYTPIYIQIYDNYNLFGYRISKNNPDPYESVEYLYDAVGMTPAKMNFDSDIFDYGSWKDVWFVKNNRPVEFGWDGTIRQYLDDSSRNSTGIDNTNKTTENMVLMPLVWFFRFEDEHYYYEIVSNYRDPPFDMAKDFYFNKYTFQPFTAYAHTDASRMNNYYSIYNYFLVSMYEPGARTLTSNDLTEIYNASGYLNKSGSYLLTSRPGLAIKTNMVLHDDIYFKNIATIYDTIYEFSNDATQAMYDFDNNLCKKNTKGYYVAASNRKNWGLINWHQYQYLRTLCTLMGKSLNTQAVFGNGNMRSGTAASALVKAGTLDGKGQFYGKNVNNSAVKVFHLDNLWGNTWTLMDPRETSNYEGELSSSAYHLGRSGNLVYNSNIDYSPTASKIFITTMKCNMLGMVPINTSGGSNSTYFCDIYYWLGNGSTVSTGKDSDGDPIEEYWINVSFGASATQAVNDGGLYSIASNKLLTADTGSYNYSTRLAYKYYDLNSAYSF